MKSSRQISRACIRSRDLHSLMNMDDADVGRNGSTFIIIIRAAWFVILGRGVRQV